MNTRKILEECLELAQSALAQGNYPIGSILTDTNGEVISVGQNENTTTGDITAHAEMQCLRKAGLSKVSKDLLVGSFLFSSEEPCCGCSFFIARTNIKKVCWALTDPHRGGLGHLKSISEFSEMFKNIEIVVEPYSDLKEKSKELMKNYFISKDKPELANLY